MKKGTERQRDRECLACSRCARCAAWCGPGPGGAEGPFPGSRSPRPHKPGSVGPVVPGTRCCPSTLQAERHCTVVRLTLHCSQTLHCKQRDTILQSDRHDTAVRHYTASRQTLHCSQTDTTLQSDRHYTVVRQTLHCS